MDLLRQCAEVVMPHVVLPLNDAHVSMLLGVNQHGLHVPPAAFPTPHTRDRYAEGEQPWEDEDEEEEEGDKVVNTTHAPLFTFFCSLTQRQHAFLNWSSSSIRPSKSLGVQSYQRCKEWLRWMPNGCPPIRP